MKKKWVSMVLTVVLALTPALPASAELQSDTGAPVQEVSSVAEDDQTAGTELPELKYGEDAPDAVTLGSETGQASVQDTEEDAVIELQAVSGDYTYTVTDGEATITKYSGECCCSGRAGRIQSNDSRGACFFREYNASECKDFRRYFENGLQCV